ncbi:hypothetical protein JCM10212_001899 [Sporobolomyces blumeae]
MSTSPGGDKGKVRAVDPDDLENAPLLASDPTSRDSTTTAPSPAPTRRTKNHFRNGRRDLDAQDDDDEDDDDTLIPNGGSSEDDRDREAGLVRVVSAPPPRRTRLSCTSIVCLFFAFLFVLSLVVAAALHLWLGHLLSEQAKHGTPEDMAQRGLLLVGPSSVKVNPVEGGDEARIVVEVEGMAGIDCRKALGWEAKEDGKWLRRIENRLARWAVRKAHSVHVEVGQVDLYDGAGSFGESEGRRPLIVVEGMDPLELPLSYPTKAEPILKMQPFTLQIPVSFPSPKDLVEYGQAAWRSREYDIEAVVASVQVKIDRGRAAGRIGMDGIKKRILGQIPDLPPPSDPMSLVDLVSYAAFEAPSPRHPNETVVAMDVRAVMKDPLHDAVKEGRIPAVAWGMPFRLPVSIHLPLPPDESLALSRPDEPAATDVTLARISTAPFSFPLHAKTAEIAVTGRVVPAGNLIAAPSEDQPPLSRALSRFVARYLSGRPNDVIIRYDSNPDPPLESDPAPTAPFPPKFVSDLARDYSFVFKLPGTNEVPDVFHNLRMEDMKIKLGGGGGEGEEADLLASGKVVGEVVLPEAAKGLEEAINTKRIWPDVLVYDGDLPRSSFDLRDEDLASYLTATDQLWLSTSSSSGTRRGGVDEQADYPPNPLPENAFARMRPLASMPATTIHYPANATHNATTIVSATFVDAPLFLLPGRAGVLRKFISKVVFSGKTKASMKGISGVELALGGFGEIGLQDIPIEASFMVGRNGVGAVEDA